MKILSTFFRGENVTIITYFVHQITPCRTQGLQDQNDFPIGYQLGPNVSTQYFIQVPKNNQGFRLGKGWNGT